MDILLRRFSYFRMRWLTTGNTCNKRLLLHNNTKNMDYVLSHVKRVNNEERVEIITGEEVYPGLSMSPNFISSHNEEYSILKELDELKEKYIFQPFEDLQVKTNDTSGDSINIVISSFRVTGRPEADRQLKAPWGYGDNFDLQRLSSSAPLLFELANRLCSLQVASAVNKLDIGDLRDITINFRQNSMFKLDPHIDPLPDGGHVFIVGLKSDVVLTLTPDLNQLESILSPSATTAAAIAADEKKSSPKLKVRMTEETVALRSWTDLDIDILLRKGVLLHLQGPARYQWKHAIRTGVVVDAETQEGERRPVICDWWGDINSLIPRNMDRVSIVFAFNELRRKDTMDQKVDKFTHLSSPLFSETNIEQVNSVRRLLLEKYTDLYQNYENWLSNEQILRFLIARNYDVDGSVNLLVTALKWRQIRKPDQLQYMVDWDVKMSKESETGKIYCPGYDKWSRPVLIFDNTVQNTNVVDDQMNFLAWNLEFATQLMPEGIDKYLVFINLKKFSLFSAPPFAATKETIHMLCNCYPERLGHCIVYQPPTIFYSFFNAVKIFLDPKTVSKVVFVVGDVSDGSPNDKLMQSIIGDNWKSLTGAEQAVLKPGNSPGYDHEVYWPTVLERVRRLEERKSGHAETDSLQTQPQKTEDD